VTPFSRTWPLNRFDALTHQFERFSGQVIQYRAPVRARPAGRIEHFVVAAVGFGIFF